LSGSANDRDSRWIELYSEETELADGRLREQTRLLDLDEGFAA